MEGWRFILSCFALQVYLTEGAWYGYNYWKERYGGDGIGYKWSTVFFNDHPQYPGYDEKKFTSQEWSDCDWKEKDPDPKKNFILHCVQKGRNTKYTVRNYNTIHQLREKDPFPASTTEITITRTPNFWYIPPKVFHNLINLEKLTIRNSRLYEIPDLTRCTNLKVLDLYDNDIKIFRHNYTKLPESLEEINLIANKIDKIPDDFFSLPKLKYLGLSQNKMRYFPGNAFHNVNELQYVGADANRIKTISRRNLESLSLSPSFVHLNLSNNILNYIAPKALTVLEKMLILELHRNPMKDVAKEVFWNISKLVHLDLNFNELSILTSQFVHSCPKLRVLILHSQKPGSKMETVYFDSLQDLPSLQEVWLGSNSLTRFPHPVFFEGSWPKLQILRLDNNQLTSLSDYSKLDFPDTAQVYYSVRKQEFHPFQKMTALTTLYADGNWINEIKQIDLEYCHTLNYLDLSHNHLREDTIHENAFKNTSLTQLLLGSQKAPGIRYIPTAIRGDKLELLKNIDLSFNGITYVLNGTFSGFNALTEIDLQKNEIIAIEDGSFSTISTQIKLNDNKFWFKHRKPFQGLVNLKELDLSNNQIKVVPNEAFFGLNKLEKLYLSGNKIGILTKTHFRDCKDIKLLHISANDIAYIERGTFLNVGRRQKLNLDLGENKISRIPSTDFSNFKLANLNLKNNRIMKIQNGAFVNISCDEKIILHYNRIEHIEAHAFENIVALDINVGGKDDKTVPGKKIPYNNVKRIDSYAFVNVNVRQIDLSYLSVENLPKNALMIKGLTGTLYLNDGKLKTIETNSLILGVIGGSVDISRSNLESLRAKIFSAGTKFRDLIMTDNKLSVINDNAFEGASMTGNLDVKNNRLKYFPIAFQTFKDLYRLNMDDNLIENLPANSLDKFSKIDRFQIQRNKLTRIRSGLLKNNPNMKHIYIDSNEITTLDKDVFSFNAKDTSKLEYISATQTKIKHVPKFMDKLNHIQYLDLKDVQTVAKDAFSNINFAGGKRDARIEIDTDLLNCDCNWYQTLLSGKIRNRGGRKSKCKRPAALENRDWNTAKRNQKKDFICTPENIVLSAPTDYTIMINYTYPTNFYPDGPAISSKDVLFNATCVLSDGSGSTTFHGGAKNKEIITIFDPVRLKPGRVYECFLTMSFEESGKLVTSAHSETIPITTKERKAKASSCKKGDPYECEVFQEFTPCQKGCNVTASEALHPGACDSSGCCRYCYRNCKKCKEEVKAKIKVPVTYYDFASDNLDFSNDHRDDKGDDCCPRYISSPYVSWLALRHSQDIKRDSFSKWFHTANENKVIQSEIVLLNEVGKIDEDGNPIYTYWDDQYWAVNGQGFGAQGQKDCSGKELINFGFTSAIRTSFKFTGKERFHFAGGEDLWVYINKVLVVSLISSNNESYVSCITFHLKKVKEGGFIVPSRGIVDKTNKKCTNLKEAPHERVNLKLLLGVDYHLDVFHVERFKCTSEFLFHQSGVDNLAVGPAIDFISHPAEDLPPPSIVQEFSVSDVFDDNPPYSVIIQNGNEQQRFLIKENSSDVRNTTATKHKPTAQKNVTLHGETIFICENLTANVTSTSNNPMAIKTTDYKTFTNLTLATAVILLDQSLDYETTPSYLLNMTIIDHVGNRGTLFIKILVKDISDNCPIIQDKIPVISLHPLPPLQRMPLWNINATDADSGDNGRISFVVSEILASSEIIDSKSYNVSGVIHIVNTTTSRTVTMNLFAVDNGTPRRGDYFRVSITYAASCDQGKLIVNETSGEVYFHAPGMTRYDNTTVPPRRGLGECYFCSAGSFCPGNGDELDCVQNDETKNYFSFGGAAICRPCPNGSLCHGGKIKSCAPNTYITYLRNATSSPRECLPCPSGVDCHDGTPTICPVGTFSDGKRPCQLCPPGSYTNTTKSATCGCCGVGEESTHMKDGCKKCEHREYSNGNCSVCMSCAPHMDCACNHEPCFKGVTCHNIGVDGKDFECEACPDGYIGDGRVCTDINECDYEPCSNRTRCINLSPGFKCTGCPFGYKGGAPAGVGIEKAKRSKQLCTDIDECDTGENRCDNNAACINTPGSYRCGKCRPGYVGDGDRGCHSGDYCATGKHDCHNNATCIPLGATFFYCKCKDGFAGDGSVCALDDDYDGISSHGGGCNDRSCAKDNCINTPNYGQEDFDQDSLGDVCDDDDDGDTISDVDDNCPFFPSRDQSDGDGDGVGDVCDNCKAVTNPDQNDVDEDGIGDACDPDIDDDGFLNAADNCKYVWNKDQKDTDSDGVGDKCDNCWKVANTNQMDKDQSGFGDICEGTGSDVDGDSIPNEYDNCPNFPNADQANADGDAHGDLCDTDKDNDGVFDVDDNCIYVRNPDQNHTDNYDMNARDVGVACVHDYDGDGTKDANDVCPYTSNIHDTSFLDHQLIEMDNCNQDEKPKWRVKKTLAGKEWIKGRDMEQLKTTLCPSILLTAQRYSDVEYSGVLNVNSRDGIDYIGVVFGFQSNKKFFVVMWRMRNYNINGTSKAGIKGVQLKLVDSKSGPSKSMMQALWHSDDTSDEVQLLWQDPKMSGWAHQASYIFRLEIRPSLGRLRLKIQLGTDTIIDSGYIYKTLITGGRLGVYTHGQGDVIWSKLQVKCIPRINTVLRFDGNSSFVQLPTMNQLEIISSFTLFVWVRIYDAATSDMYPLVCTEDSSACMYLKNGKLGGKIDKVRLQSTKTLTDNTWYHLVFRYDAQDRILTLFVNGIEISRKEKMPQYDLDVQQPFLLGTDGVKYLKGDMDEIVIWNIYMKDDEVSQYIKLAGMSWPIHQRLITAYYPIDEGNGHLLIDHSKYGNHRNMTNIEVVEGDVDVARFRYSYPGHPVNNKYGHRTLIHL